MGEHTKLDRARRMLPSKVSLSERGSTRCYSSGLATRLATGPPMRCSRSSNFPNGAALRAAKLDHLILTDPATKEQAIRDLEEDERAEVAEL